MNKLLKFFGLVTVKEMEWKLFEERMKSEDIAEVKMSRLQLEAIKREVKSGQLEKYIENLERYLKKDEERIKSTYK